jgi:exodeoxyribonuclease V alpha subunit
VKPPTPKAESPLADCLARFLAGLASQHRELVRATVTALVQAEAAGHACLTTDATANLLASGVAGRPGEALPLICAGDRVYLRRLFLHEGAVAHALRTRLAAADLPADLAAAVPFLRSCGLLADDEADWQAVAVLAGLVRPLLVISGGPGTGKTRTAAVLLAAVNRFQPGVKVALAAPTGKAAARLGESIAKTWTDLAIGTAPAPEAMTLHRLLGASADGRRFRHGPDNPLAADLVLVDEASMVDLTLMSRLVTALRPEARLVLLGDKDQLASVEAGYVLGDLCEAVGLNRFPAAFADRLRAVGVPVPPLEPGTGVAVELLRNHRFGRGHAIPRLTARIRAGNVAATLAALGQLGTEDTVRWRDPGDTDALAAELRAAFARHLQPRWHAKTPAEALAALGHFQILCALKRGAFGRDGVNAAMESFAEAAGHRRRGQVWYPGRPILIAANAPHLGLFNGDLGIAWPDDAGRLQVWFAGPDGLRSLVPDRLPAHETAFALTVHKSQGSEFDEVLVLLPPNPAPVCTRELLYTGLTRARRQVTLLAAASAVQHAVGSGSVRGSGLAERLRE